MSFLKELKAFTRENFNKKDSDPYRVSVERKGNVFVVSGYWIEERENSFAAMGRKESTETYEYPSRYSVEVEPDSELGGRLAHALNEFDERVELAEKASVESLSLNSVIEPSGDFDTPFYTPEDADFRLLGLVTAEFDIEPPEIIGMVVDDLSDFDEDITESMISEAVFLYDDFEPCKLVSIKGDVETSNPHRYYTDVESFDDYVEVLADDKQEERELKEKVTHEVFFRLDNSHEEDGGPPEKFVDPAEELMKDYIDQLVDVEGDFMYEGERISYSNVTMYISFWLRVPTNADV